MHPLFERVRAGEMPAIARALRLVDDRRGEYEQLLRELYPHTGKAYVVGVTGNPGAGKSTLTDKLIGGFRARGMRVAVLAVDPTSPYSGGAILGDRIRMAGHTADAGVYIRSIATRGAMGGLSRSARDMVRLLDAAAFDVVLVETVGVGQDELEITRTAHTTLVVMAPGMGDEVQAIKAGLMESADVFAVNKADKDGADGTVRDLELMIALGKSSLIAMGKMKGHAVHGGSGEEEAHGVAGQASGGDAAGRWVPPIVRCVATRSVGIDDVIAQLLLHRTWIQQSKIGRARRLERFDEEIRESLREALLEAALQDMSGEIVNAAARVRLKKQDPYEAIASLVLAFRQLGGARA